MSNQIIMPYSKEELQAILLPILKKALEEGIHYYYQNRNLVIVPKQVSVNSNSEFYKIIKLN
jgi:hypothetical protein